MSAPAFTLSVPTADPYRGLVADSVRTFLRVSTKDTSPAADDFVARVAAVVDAMAGEGDEVGVVVVKKAPVVEVQLTCGKASETLTHSPAAEV